LEKGITENDTADSGHTSLHLKHVMHSECWVVAGFSDIAPVGQLRMHFPQPVQLSLTLRLMTGDLEKRPINPPAGQRFLHQNRG